MRRSQAEVEQKVVAAFAGTPYPGDDLITYDNSGRHLECRAVSDRFRGRHWQDLASDFLRREADAIFFFSDDGYAFFLPAFLLTTLRDQEGADLVPVNTVVSLSPSLSKMEKEEFGKRISRLTDAQREAVACFLSYLDHERSDYFPLGDPKVALDDFWSRYLREAE